MTKPKSLMNVLRVTMASLCIIIVCLLLYLWINEELRKAQSQFDSIRKTYIETQKETIRTLVEQTIDYIHHKRSDAEIRVKQEVKSRTNEAYETALYIYNQYKKEKSLDEIKRLIHDALYAATWDDGKGYYFVEDMFGTELVNRNNPKLEGVNILNLQDSNGTFIMKQIIEVAQSPEKEGFCSYYWNKPEYPGVHVPKISYVKYFEPLDWIIGNGKYIVDKEQEIKKEVLNRIEQIKFGSDGYVFAGTWKGVSLSEPFKGKNMLHITDPNGVKIVEELIRAAKSDGGFVEYIVPEYKGQKSINKISYAEPIPEWEWYIGTGISVDAIEKVIQQRQEQLKDDIRLLIFKCIIVLCVFILISFVLIWFFSIKIETNLAQFVEFFKQSTDKAVPIREDKIFFSEFQSLAILANQMSIERAEAQKALRASENKYRHLFKNAPAGIYEIDYSRNKVIHVNDVMSQFSGYSELELLSMNPLNLFTKESKIILEDRFEKVFTGEQLLNSVEVDLIKKNGQILSAILSYDYIYDEKVLKGARIVVHDISARKQAEAEKLKAQKIAGEQKKLALVGQIAGKIAHDFNNILGIIMGNTELLLVDCNEIDLTKKLELILKQTLRGRNLTKNLVAFAKDQEPKQEFFKVNEKIDLVLSLMKKDLENVVLVKEEGPNMPKLLADPGMIEHALVNLIQNAIHATSRVEEPKIIIRTYCPDKNIFLEIEDNGCGIPKEHIDHIYNPSFTLKGGRDLTGSYKRNIKGTGYGMANVKKYIELHRGSIAVESQSGSGTKFTIALPVIKKELTIEEKIEIRQEITHFEKYILLVEDETAISDVQYRILTQDPCNNKVDIANNGQIAMDLFDRNEYELVSLDYSLLGDINGMDVYRHIRKTNQIIPILFISGNIEFLESIKDLKQKDVNIDHMSKPCPNKDYINAINNLL